MKKNVIVFLSGVCLGTTSWIAWNESFSVVFVPDLPQLDEPVESQRSRHCNICNGRSNSTNASVAHRGRVSQREVPKFQLDDRYLKEHDRIDRENAKTRCNRYNLQPYDGPMRRLFYGTTVADDNWDLFVMHAVEVYGVYHAAVFIESNTTFIATPRALRFNNSNMGDSLTKSEMFGPRTRILLDFWLEDWPDLRELDREAEQRSTITKRWRDMGMTPDDVGIVADADEFISRDFLRAIQTCDFPELRPNQSCQRPKIVTAAVVFEISPYCIRKRPWHHPDIISGQCVDGIGDPTERVVPLRHYKGMHGQRDVTYGKHDLTKYPEAVHKSGRFPLLNGDDIRVVHGDQGFLYNFKDIPNNSAFGVAYHFHNWFADLTLLRNKYATYGHPLHNMDVRTLSQIGEDVDLTVRCLKGIKNTETTLYAYFEAGRDTPGPKPIFFLNTTYLDERHKKVQAMFDEDSQKYGTNYDSDNRWVDKPVLMK